MLVDAPQVAKSGMKGKGMAVIHTFGDQLWMLATAVTAPAGFSPYRVYSLAPSSDSDSDVEGGADGVETTREADQHAAGANSAPQSDSISSTVEGMGNLSVSEDSSKPAEEGEHEPVGESASSSQAVSPEMVDETIMQCFLSALHDTRDDELPILVSSLQSSKVATYVPAGSVADIKQSSFKKLSKFVAHLKKLKLIDVKELGGDFQLMKVHRSHQLFKDFVPLKAHALNRGKGSADAEEDEEESKLGIQEMFQVPQSVGPALLGDAYRPKALFSKRDLTDALTHYVRENGLVSAANGNMVQLDPILTDIVRKSVKEHVEAVTKKDLFTTHLFAAMKKFTVIQRPDAPDAPIIVSGAVKHVEVAVERRAGRVMTRISHLDKYGIDLDAFAAECQRKFAASATTDVGQSNLREVLIQGDQRKQVPSFVTEALGIPSMYVTVRK
jgi:translation initiation factor 2D